MKKLILIALLFTFASCGVNTPDPSTSNDDTAITSVDTNQVIDTTVVDTSAVDTSTGITTTGVDTMH